MLTAPTLPAVIAALFLLPAVASLSHGLHTDSGQPLGTDLSDTGFRRFYVPPLSSAVWWDQSAFHGIPTGLTSQTYAFELSHNDPAGVAVTAETHAYVGSEIAKTCSGPETPTIWIGLLVAHGGRCRKPHGYSVQIHYFPWSQSSYHHPDHVDSPQTWYPTTAMVVLPWRFDLVYDGYKSALIPPGKWQVWIDPVGGPTDYAVEYRFHNPRGNAFYLDYMGQVGCPQYTELTFYVVYTDQQLAGCPTDYNDEPMPEP